MFKNKKLTIFIEDYWINGELTRYSWYEKTFTNKNSAIINTYFQTETGGIICSPKLSYK